MPGMGVGRRHGVFVVTLVLFAVLFLVAFPVFAVDEGVVEGVVGEGAESEEVSRFEEPIVPRNDLSIGGELYRSECSGCHAATGIGGALSFRGNAPPLEGFSALEMAAAIRGGPRELPLFGPDSISDEELSQIVTYSVYLQNPDDIGGAPIGRVGPVMEGFVAWAVGMSAIVLGLMWIGDRRA